MHCTYYTNMYIQIEPMQNIGEAKVSMPVNVDGANIQPQAN